MKFFCISLVLFSFVLSSWSQEYKRMISSGIYTVQEIQEEAEAYFAILGGERGKGYKPYKRWEYQALRTMDEKGMLKTPDFYFYELENYNNYLNQNSQSSRVSVEGDWVELGPTLWNQTSGWNPGVGRITSIAVDQVGVGNPNHIIVGANTGGVWRTIDGGTTWSVLTDNMSNLYVWSLAIDPTNASIYYWGSSNGTIFKSTDSGATWNLLADIVGGNLNKILIDPNNTLKMYCTAEGEGIFKSIDGGVTWSIINASATNGYDIEFKPGDTNTIYASGNEFFKSPDGGSSFSAISGFTNGSKMIGVSANDPSIVYVLEASGGIFGALYKSTDSGNTFTELDHTGKNYFGYSSLADDNIGQAPRDMDIAINPNNVDEVHIASINTWSSIAGGVSFNITSQWVPGTAATQNIGQCHADIDILEFVGNKLYVGSDGGIFVAENTTTVNSTYYTDLTAGLGIKQFYKIGVSQTDPEVVTGGSQDNGTSVYDTTGTWKDWLGADGMESFVDKNDSNILYGTIQFGALYKSITGGNSYFDLSEPDGKGVDNTWNWVVPFEQDPLISDAIYVAYDEVYKSIDGGVNWTSISQNFADDLDHLKVAPSDNNILYASINGSLYKTVDGGATNWMSLSGFSGFINSIAIHPSNPNKIAIATNSTEKVYVSIDGGANWSSYLKDLPNFISQALVWEDNGVDGLYLGMNYGVYYIDNTFVNWQPFSNNLPNVIISELEVNTANNKVYAATYGRGLWRSNNFATSLSVKEFELNNISLYPNPTSKVINLLWNRNDHVTIKIFNAIGKLVYFAKNKNLIKPLSIDVSQYASGLYFVKINNTDSVITKKLIVK